MASADTVLKKLINVNHVVVTSHRFLLFWHPGFFCITQIMSRFPRHTVSLICKRESPPRILPRVAGSCNTS